MTNHKTILTAFTCITIFCSQWVHAESWTSLGGGRTVEARMLGIWGDSVVLQMDGNRRVTVKLNDLVADSRIQARKLAAKQKTFRDTVIDEIKSAAAEASAPAPNPIPKPDPAPVYVPKKTGGTAVDQLEWFQGQVESGHLIAWFDMLPPKYQNDLDEIAKLASTKIDPNGLTAFVGTIHGVGDLIVTRQRWFFSHPRFVASGENSVDALERLILPIAGLIRDGLNPADWDVAKFQSMPLRSWLMGRDKALAPYLFEMNELSGGMTASFELKSEKDGVAAVEISLPGFKQVTNFVSVDGHWIPEDIAKNWDEGIAKAKTGLASAYDGSMMADASPLSMIVTPTVNALKQAETAKDFHATLEPLFAMAAPALQSMSQFAPGAGPPGRMGRGGGMGDEGYGDSGYGDSGYGNESGYGNDSGYGSGSGDGGYPDGGMEGYGSGSGTGYGGSSGPPPGSGSGMQQGAQGYGGGSSAPPRPVGAGYTEQDFRSMQNGSSRPKQ